MPRIYQLYVHPVSQISPSPLLPKSQLRSLPLPSIHLATISPAVSEANTLRLDCLFAAVSDLQPHS